MARLQARDCRAGRSHLLCQGILSEACLQTNLDQFTCHRFVRGEATQFGPVGRTFCCPPTASSPSRASNGAVLFFEQNENCLRQPIVSSIIAFYVCKWIGNAHRPAGKPAGRCVAGSCYLRRAATFFAATFFAATFFAVVFFAVVFLAGAFVAAAAPQTVSSMRRVTT